MGHLLVLMPLTSTLTGEAATQLLGENLKVEKGVSFTRDSISPPSTQPPLDPPWIHPLYPLLEPSRGSIRFGCNRRGAGDHVIRCNSLGGRGCSISPQTSHSPHPRLPRCIL